MARSFLDSGGLHYIFDLGFNEKPLTEELRKAIEDFVSVYHEGTKPFGWRKPEVKGAQLRNTITNFCN